MRLSAVTRRFLSVALVASIAALGACTPAETPADPPASGTGGKAPGKGGSGGGSGGKGGSQGSGGASGGAGSGGSGGGSGGSGSGGSAGSGGASGGSGGASGAGGSAGAGGKVGDAGPAEAGAGAGGTPAAGWAGFEGVEDLSTEKKSAGCGMEPGQALGDWVKFNVAIPTPPGRGTGNRVYFIKLPANYDKTKAYRLIFVVPGCSGTGNNMWDFTTAAGAEGVIQIGLNPDPGGSKYPGLLCFDNERTDTVEFKFFETLLDIASKKLCFDQHRVFFTGHSSGSFVSNDVGCVYGSKSVRAIAPSSGGLITLAGQAPPCSNFPMPGIWSHNEDDTGNLPLHTKAAINRALKVNKCTGNFDTSPRMPYPGNPSCEKFSTCPPEFPIVYCHPKTGGHTGNLDVQPARTWAFFKSLP